jgi:hypothetical protein
MAVDALTPAAAPWPISHPQRCALDEALPPFWSHGNPIDAGDAREARRQGCSWCS